MTWLLVCLAGGLGAVARALVDSAVAPRPAWWGTLGINITGSFLLGLLAQLLSGDALAIVGTGFLGGFTTFSTASWQVARELGRRRHGWAAAYLTGTVAACLLAAWLGGRLAGA